MRLRSFWVLQDTCKPKCVDLGSQVTIICRLWIGKKGGRKEVVTIDRFFRSPENS